MGHDGNAIGGVLRAHGETDVEREAADPALGQSRARRQPAHHAEMTPTSGSS